MSRRLPPVPIVPVDIEVRLKKTCPTDPEQYDACDAWGTQIGYLRLRYHEFTVHYPNIEGTVIYRATPRGDGSFRDHERRFYLGEAVKRIRLAVLERYAHAR